MRILLQSTAVVVQFGPFVDKTDGNTYEIALVGTGANQLESTTTGIRISKNGAALAARSATATASTYDALGMYLVTLSTTDTGTLGQLRMAMNNNDALTVWEDFLVVPANIYNSLVLGTDILDVSVTQLLGTAWLTPGTAGTPDVNAKLVGALAVVSGAIPNAVAGAAGGIQIAGSNAATTYATLTVTGATTLTGNVALADGITVAAPSTGNRAGITITGNGTGPGITTTGGATGPGILATGGGNNAAADGIRAVAGGALADGIETGSLNVTGTLTAVTNAIAWNAAWDAEVESEVNDALVVLNLDHLMKTAMHTPGVDMTTEVVDNTVLSRILANGDTSVFDTSTDGLQLIRDKLPTNLEDLNIVDTTGLVDITQTAADKVWATAARVLTANTNLANLEVDLTKIHGTAITETAGQLAAAFTKLFDVAAPVLTCASVNQVQDNATVAEIWAGTGAITSLAYSLLLERLYEMVGNKMIVTEATGAVALRNLVDGADIATGNVQDLGATTVRSALTFV